MKTLIAIMLMSLLSTTALNSPPLREGPEEVPGKIPGEGVDPIEPAGQAARPAATTFTTIDIIIDPQGQALGAYQFELTSEDAAFTVVGVEAGEHEAFNHGRPPYFDPVAKQGETDRVVLAEYALPTLDAGQLPTDAVRVARIHVEFAGQQNQDEQPAIQLKLTTAGNADGEPINAQISYSFRTPERPQ